MKKQLGENRDGSACHRSTSEMIAYKHAYFFEINGCCPTEQ
jgi:hypothetical protein